MAGWAGERVQPCRRGVPEEPCPCSSSSVVDLIVGADDVAAFRFGPDPVWETVASLDVLAHPGRHQLHRPLLDRVGEPAWDHGLLMGLVSHDQWFPVMLAPEPRRLTPDPVAALEALVETPEDVAADDLDALRRVDPESDRWRRYTPAQLLEETATALAAYWSAVLAPMWERVWDIAVGDIAFRSRTLAADGLGVTLAGVHERMSFQGGRLRLDMPGHHQHRDVGGAGVRFVPSVFRWPCLVVEIESAPPVVSYAARGAARVWEASGTEPKPGLDPVLGRSRVAILSHLDAPTTTTRLARMLKLSVGTVNEHLTAMTRAGLLSSTRRGREVLYERTDLGQALFRQPR